MPHGSVILAAKLIAGYDAEGERREPRPGRSGCRRCPRSDSLAGDGHHHPAGRNPAGGHARERRGGAGRRGPGRQGAGGCGCPERPSSYSAITLSDEGGQRERTRTRRYLKHIFGCLRCKRGGSWASARTRYLQRCPRCSRCNSRRCPLPGPLPGLPRRVPLRRPGLADQLPAGARRCRAPDGCAFEPGELGVPGDRRGPDRAGAATGRGGRPGGVVAAASAPATARVLKRLASGLVPSRAGITACGRKPSHPRPGRPQARPSAGAPRRIRARRTPTMTPVMTPPRGCGGDMSSPQKCPSTRHDSATASDNRR